MSCGGESQKEIWSLLSRAEYWNPHDRSPDFVTLQNGYPQMPSRYRGDDSLSKPQIISEDFHDSKYSFRLTVPVFTFNNLNLVERDEVESLRAIENLFRTYQDRVRTRPNKEKSLSPLSIAVFGAPGTGKSFMVKQLVGSVGKKPALDILEFNVGQFSKPRELDKVMRQVASYRDPDKLPLVFFDEFDCAKDDLELGWLKYFLAPMQDGKTATGETLPSVIFVFAGGIHSSFWAFDPRTDSAYDNLRHSSEYQMRVQQFTARKGPDFISRLRGHIDVLPINNQAGQPKHFI